MSALDPKQTSSSKRLIDFRAILARGHPQNDITADQAIISAAISIVCSILSLQRREAHFMDTSHRSIFRMEVAPFCGVDTIRHEDER